MFLQAMSVVSVVEVQNAVKFYLTAQFARIRGVIL
jgi:hypothetical protein